MEIHSYLSEVHASLSSLLSNICYAKYYNIKFHNEIEMLYNSEILDIVSPHPSITYATSSQDDHEEYNILLVITRFNIDTNKIEAKNINKLINTHLLSVLFVIYIGNEYTFWRFERKFREVTSSMKSKLLLERNTNGVNKK